jgi:hypothetical protein
MTTATALLIPPLPLRSTTVTAPDPVRLELPETGQYAWRTQHLGGQPEAAYYHRHAAIHVHGNGIAEDLPANPVAWALACAWSGQQLDYALYGPVLITGTENDQGGFAPLPEQFAARTERAIDAANSWWLDHAYFLPQWLHSVDSPAFAPAVTHIRNAL